ncbi:Protein of unknown function (DUF2486) [Paraburkholderia caribensis MBA4]|uniref:DUF2486 domain-containing protein n=1 Tax=Paraburkholderia caribensis MBA4 TaxID=1323664 RepID=A0A0P0R8E0_9BURK|nr:DUF2486 family protein [Paraburkholderia caribensis]ALL64415.1 Protein of unknown function (DUF2486) [Paraburkholderia caribensis MBA4]
MSQSSDPSDSSDQDIPILTDVMETGHEPHAKAKRPKRSSAHAHEGAHARRHGTAHGAQDDASHDAPHETKQQPAAHAEPQTPSVQADDDVPVLDAIYESPRTPMREPAQFVPGEAEFTSGSSAEHYVAPPVPDSLTAPVEHAAAPTPAPTPAARSDYDADVLAERLRGRFATYLKGDGRNLIEARCRDAFQDHTTWLVNQITREVALALETEMLSWVREAIREELGNSTTSK